MALETVISTDAVLNKTTLVVGDLHYKGSRLGKIMPKIEAEILRHVDDVKPRMIVLLGDILDTHAKIGLEEHCRASQFILTLKSKCERVVVLIGNHDRVGNSNINEEIHAFVGFTMVPGITIVNKPTVLNDDMAALPYVSKGTLMERVNEIENPKRFKLIFAHPDIIGASLTSTMQCTEGDVWPEDYPALIAGHYHSRQQPFHNVYYIGTPYQTNFGEAPSNFLAYICPEFTIRFLEMQNIPKFYTATTTSLTEYLTFLQSANYREDDYYKITASNFTKEEIATLEANRPHNITLVIEAKRASAPSEAMQEEADVFNGTVSDFVKTKIAEDPVCHAKLLSILSS